MDYSLPEDSLFLGFDCSTQSLKATILDANLSILTAEVVHFDSELPQYNTRDGVYRDPLVNGRIVSSPLMWVEALDLLLGKFVNANLGFGSIAAVSGSAQQHGSVYWKKGSSMLLASLDSKKPLLAQLSDAFATKESPIWMDSSTAVECRAIEIAVGALELAQLTGSHSHESFAGPQIRKIFKTQPDVYHDTEWISLISSFITSLLIGGDASINETYGSGTNLMDVKQRAWLKIALEATAPGLEAKLGKLAPAHDIAGLISFRSKIRNQCAQKSWDVFNKFLEETPPLNGGKLGFYYKKDEILPPLSDLASLGAALRAAHGWLYKKEKRFVPISCLYKHKLEKTSLACELSMPAGDKGLLSKYTLLMKKRTEIEDRLVQKLG